jgi:hypothetical protein
VKAPENPRGLPTRVARAAGYALAALAYLTFLLIAGADAGSRASEPVESSSQVEVAARLP